MTPQHSSLFQSLRRFKIDHLAVLAVGILLLLFLKAGRQRDALLHHPLHVTYSAVACGALHSAKSPDGKTPMAEAPCEFTAYLFPIDLGAIGYGVSDNIKGECLLLGEVLKSSDIRSAAADFPDLPTPMVDIPAKCEAEYKDILQHSRQETPR
jgi:hypothetical protein